MTARKQPTAVAHFTHVEHLTTVIRHGLMSDTAARAAGMLSAEIGNPGIKDQRRHRVVPLPPGGTVADYVPFYFAPRSPMMFAISRGNVPSYQEGTARLVYLISTLDRLHALGHRPLLTDRNAALSYAEYRAFDPADPIDDGFVDWGLMTQTYWSSTPDEPERMERRMAEALVHQRVPWNAITQVAAQNDLVGHKVRATLAAAHLQVPVIVRPDWYF